MGDQISKMAKMRWLPALVVLTVLMFSISAESDFASVSRRGGFLRSFTPPLHQATRQPTRHPTKSPSAPPPPPPAAVGRDVKTCHFWPPILPDWLKYVSKTCTGSSGSKLADHIKDDRGSCKVWKINGEDYQRCSSCGPDEFLIGLAMTAPEQNTVGVCMRVSMHPESGDKFPWTDIGMRSKVNFMEFGHSETQTAKFLSQVVITDNDRTVLNPLITEPPSPTKAPTGDWDPSRPPRGGGFLSTTGSFTLSGGNGHNGGNGVLGEDDMLSTGGLHSSSSRLHPSSSRLVTISSIQAAKIQQQEVTNKDGDTVRQVLEVTTEVNEAEQATRPYVLQIQNQQGFAYGNMVLKDNRWERHVSAYFVQGTKWTSCVPVLTNAGSKDKTKHAKVLKKCTTYKNTHQCYEKTCPFEDTKCEGQFMDSAQAFVQKLKSTCGEMHEVIINSM